MKINTVFFDLFFTLITLDYSYDNIEDYEFTALGITKGKWDQIENETYKERATGKTNTPLEMMEYIVKDLGIEPMRIEKAVEKRIGRIQRGIIKCDNGTFTIVSELHKKGMKTCLISNCDILDKYVIAKMNLNKYFDDVILSYDVGITKPDSGIYELALERTKSKPDNCLFVGDGGNNELLGAKRVGIKTVLTIQYIKDLWKEKIPELRENADYVINDLSEINGIVDV